ncbi:MAG: hypothetical protein HN729_10920 [Candidatus Marinimicrobia bacterium]|nr:hypothetical protein [Candidatus Neomarinimicrobiota bacterium]MBT3633565.1 hypothetical protein [Candidatus Neomarinimicrobiota bacterium]MBT3682482.1 hypothetical protein [Candidatus Neomarinimicrobiota bacterium]MBT3759246.1 hypothetical protein [Candidatus Neomarinimicrobiota bacterium]MBT3895481.1 hypothetical protein [Candidatus Neomarinimicrobiota bacterium]
MSPANEHITSGIHNLYSYHFDKAINSLDSALIVDPHHPVQPFIRLAVNWLQAQTECGYDSSYAIIEQEVKNLVPWYKKHILQYPDNAEYPLYLGSVYGMKARISLAKKKWLDVIISGYRGYNYIDMAKDIDPQLKDIYMPFGLMEYYSCKMPGSIQFIAGLFGINSDCETGLGKLETAANESYYSWIESSNVLVYAYLYIEKDYHSALKWVHPLVAQFPENPMFLLLYGETLAKLKMWDELDEVLPQIYPFTQQGSHLLTNECNLKYQYLLALKEFDNQNYENVIELTTNIITDYQMEFDWLLGFAHILRGKCYDINGDRNQAVMDYKVTANLDNKYPEVAEAKALIETAYKL